MAGRDPIEVTVEIDGAELTAGTLWIHERGGQSATFRYADSYLAHPAAYELDPALPKGAGVFHTAPGAALFGAFADSARSASAPRPQRPHRELSVRAIS